MHINKVEICGVNTSELPVLKNSEMRVLFDRIHKGDDSAREEFIQGNLRLVLSVIQRFNNRGEHVDDLFQVGCIENPIAYNSIEVVEIKQCKTRSAKHQCY
jgi:RNA polymerase sporulation-specific sigma factor